MTGRHRQRWLHNLTTQDIKGLVPGQGRYTTCVTEKGRLVGEGQVYDAGDRLILVVPEAALAELVAHLRRYIVAEDVALHELSPRDAVVSFVGPAAPRCLEALLQTPLTGLTQVDSGYGDVLVLPRVRLNQPGIDCVGTREALEALLRASGAVEATEAAWDGARIAAAIPEWGRDLDATIVPLEAGLYDGVHWKKGCYLGQETIAKMAHRGHTTKELRQLQGARGAAEGPGTALFPLRGPFERPVARLTSVGTSPQDESRIALGMVRREHFEPGTQLVAHDGAAPWTVTQARIRGATPPE